MNSQKHVKGHFGFSGFPSKSVGQKLPPISKSGQSTPSPKFKNQNINKTTINKSPETQFTKPTHLDLSPYLEHFQSKSPFANNYLTRSSIKEHSNTFSNFSFSEIDRRDISQQAIDKIQTIYQQTQPDDAEGHQTVFSSIQLSKAEISVDLRPSINQNSLFNIRNSISSLHSASISQLEDPSDIQWEDGIRQKFNIYSIQESKRESVSSEKSVNFEGLHDKSEGPMFLIPGIENWKRQGPSKKSLIDTQSDISALDEISGFHNVPGQNVSEDMEDKLDFGQIMKILCLKAPVEQQQKRKKRIGEHMIFGREFSNLKIE